ncbi:MAG: stage III sporulation protein AB [Muricoprocola sp.]
MSMILAASISLGQCFSKERKKRIEMLSALREMLTYIMEEIRYLETPLMQILTSEKMKQQSGLQSFFEAVAEELKKCQGKNLSEIMKENSGLLKECAGLLQKDCDQLLLYLGQLGGMNKTMQMKLLERYEKELEREIEDARKEYEDNAGLYRSMGLLGGLFLGILFA